MDGAASHRPPNAPATIPPGDSLDDRTAPDRLVRDITMRENDAVLLAHTFVGSRRGTRTHWTRT